MNKKQREFEARKAHERKLIQDEVNNKNQIFKENSSQEICCLCGNSTNHGRYEYHTKSMFFSCIACLIKEHKCSNN